MCGSIQAAAQALAIAAVRVFYSNAAELVRGIDAFATEPNGGLIVLQPPPPATDRETIIRLATQHRLPAVCGDKSFTSEGGLIAYATDPADLYWRAPFYV